MGEHPTGGHVPPFRTTLRLWPRPAVAEYNRRAAVIKTDHARGSGDSALRPCSKPENVVHNACVNLCRVFRRLRQWRGRLSFLKNVLMIACGNTRRRDVAQRAASALRRKSRGKLGKPDGLSRRKRGFESPWGRQSFQLVSCRVGQLFSYIRQTIRHIRLQTSPYNYGQLQCS